MSDPTATGVSFSNGVAGEFPTGLATITYLPAQPATDAQLRAGDSDPFTGVGEFAPTPQQVSVDVQSGESAAFVTRLVNRGPLVDRVTVSAPARSGGFSGLYLDGETDVSASVADGTYTTPPLRPGDSHTLRLGVNTEPSAHATATFTVNATSNLNPGGFDEVTALVSTAEATVGPSRAGELAATGNDRAWTLPWA